MGVKSIWVKAPFKEEGTWQIEKFQNGTTKRKIEKGFFGKKVVEEEVPVYEERKVWKVTKVSDCEIDGERFNKNIEAAIRKLEEEGLQVISITPVISGKYEYDYNVPATYGWGYGFSYTEGVSIIARC